jgi:hypothetical protein
VCVHTDAIKVGSRTCPALISADWCYYYYSGYYLIRHRQGLPRIWVIVQKAPDYAKVEEGASILRTHCLTKEVVAAVAVEVVS